MKRVHFNSISKGRLYTLTPEEKQYKKTYWTRVAVDRVRFENRIHKTGYILGDTLSDEHREKIYTERFKEN